MTEDLLHATVSVRGVILNSRGKVLTLQRTSDHEWELLVDDLVGENQRWRVYNEKYMKKLRCRPKLIVSWQQTHG